MAHEINEIQPGIRLLEIESKMTKRDREALARERVQFVSLDVDAIDSLDILASAPLIERLILNSTAVRDPSVLAHLPHLRSLSLRSSRFEVSPDPGQLKHVRCVDLESDSLKGNEWILDLPCLEVLSIYTKQPIKSLELFKTLPALRSLLVECGAYENLRGIESLRSLQRLYNDQPKRLDSLDGLEAAPPSLVSLRVSKGGRKIASLEPLRAVPRLLHFALDEEQKGLSIAPLRSLRELRVVWLRDRKPSPEDIEVLRSLPRLRHAGLPSVRDVTALGLPFDIDFAVRQARIDSGLDVLLRDD